MAFGAITNHNPFLLPFLLVLFYLLLRRVYLNKPGYLKNFFQKTNKKRLIYALLILDVILFVLTMIFEMYFSLFQCQVSSNYYRQNIEMSRTLLALFLSHSIPLWLDYATLLNQLRQQDINGWDHDVDFSTVHPAHLKYMKHVQLFDKDMVFPHGAATFDEALRYASSHPGSVGPANTIEELISKIESTGYKCSFDEPRMLVQIWGQHGMKGPHVDLWLWTLGGPAGEYTSALPSSDVAPDADVLMWTADFTVAYNPRPAAALFPLQQVQWLKQSVLIPKESHLVSSREFDRFGGSYMKAQVFRGDCFHNFFNLRWMY